MTKSGVFIATAHHWADNSSYVIGVFLKKAQALKAAKHEVSYRGGKYSARVEEQLLQTKFSPSTDVNSSSLIAEYPDWQLTNN